MTDIPGPTWPWHPELLARAVPRYTSYPTAAEFGDAVGPVDFARALEATVWDAGISLYVHIPYCHEICWYCGCNTGAANRTARLAAYIEALRLELDMVAEMLGGRAPLTRVAFGGGSPNALSAGTFDDLCARIETLFDTSAAVRSIEIDPRSLTADFAAAIGHHGFRSASLGVQTFSPAIQAAIGRVQPAETIIRATGLLRGAGIRSLNFDLMYGLPGQTSDDLADSLERSVALGADRLAVFGYAHVPDMLPRQRRIDASCLPDVEARFRQAGLAHGLLVGAGYRPVGFDHFARPSDPLGQAAAHGLVHRNFQGFTDDPAQVLIGVGASAISQFPDLLIQNEKNAGRYRMSLSAGRFAHTRGIGRDAGERQRARLIESLLCRGEAMLPTLSDWPLILSRLEPFLSRGLVTLDARRLAVTPDGLPYARVVASLFDRHRHVAATAFSNAI